MTTSDGISTKDWDVVHESAVAVVNATGDDDNKECLREEGATTASEFSVSATWSYPPAFMSDTCQECPAKTADER